ncbi:hypothetical protein L207DRAFT_548212 [Hyaloscypha variabilis F]|uniref:T6SS Phospholipase effector Tle1-like catalytic domain-containing protein n=1 Tax=Hyaloscypha variabilis (strain UAMH 11265 / GT02V1 / F) TaxID=1149755 RepID=A0A2J6R3S1_HYAVF|nr:hypothetical protein L207DRAFT_548212 [Hyaloscypha variabilis F]
MAIRAVPDSKSAVTGRTLVICLDGTGDKFDGDNSNVVNFVACLKKDDPTQVTYYQAGIGTYNGRGGLSKGFSAGIDMAIGSGLGIHIKDAYQFIMQNYIEGDRICLLGFSRGAYTVRCLAGMLHKVGLLPAYNTAQVNFAYQFYKDDTSDGWEMSEQFKRTFCQDVTVYFVGIWDCVASVGFIPRQLPFSKSPTNTVSYFRHAMALDEHRAKFKVCHWQKSNEVPLKTLYPAKKNAKSLLKPTAAASELKNKIIQHKDLEQSKYESKFNESDPHSSNVKTDVREVWFAGCHADVGGGAVKNSERHMLSRIPLRWMLRQCFECNTGIQFSTAALAEVGLDVRTLWPVYQKLEKPAVGPSPRMMELYETDDLPPLRRRSTALGVDPDAKDLLIGDEKSSSPELLNLDLLPEQAEDHFDAMCHINDMLVIARPWWILEIWPVSFQILKKESKGRERWEKIVGMNLGRWRAIKDPEPKMHWTVERRIAEKGYKIRNSLGTEAVWKVET